MTEAKQIRVVWVIGQGYVGLPVAMASVEVGFEVTGIDLDNRRVELLSSGKSPTPDVPNTKLQEALDQGSYAVTSRYPTNSGFDVAVITVPTPLKDGLPDLTFIESAAHSVGASVRSGCTVILESTSYPGTTEELLVPILEQESGLKAGEDFYVGYSPERIDPGNEKWDLLNTPKVVSGVNGRSRERVSAFYITLGIETVLVSGTREAEMTKLLENTFRHVNIALVNELAIFSQALGVDIWEAIDAASTKPFGFMKFSPGPGVGGHCLPVDPSYLSWAIKNKAGKSFKFVELANEVNGHMPHYVVSRVESLLAKDKKGLSRSTVLLLGLAYKANTSDIRESPAIVLATLLQNAGATVYAIDDFVSDENWPLNVMRHQAENEVAYDVAVLTTDHQDSTSESALNLIPRILDTRNVLSNDNVEKL